MNLGGIQSSPEDPLKTASGLKSDLMLPKFQKAGVKLPSGSHLAQVCQRHPLLSFTGVGEAQNVSNPPQSSPSCLSSSPATWSPFSQIWDKG